MKNAQKNVSFGAKCAEIISVRGAKCAADFARKSGRDEIAEAISWGRFNAPRGPFNAARAQARAAAMVALKKAA